MVHRLKDDVMDSPSASRYPEEEMEKGEYHNDMKTKLPDTKVQGPLKQEIMQLEKRLKDQLTVRHVLEKALGYRTTCIDTSSNDSFIPLPARELMRDIAVLELEVTYLEQYLLSLYRKVFNQQVSILPPTIPLQEKLEETISCFQPPKDEISYKQNSSVNSTWILTSQKSGSKEVDDSCCENLTDYGVLRSHTALNHRAVCSLRSSPSKEAVPTALQECHSQPLSFLSDLNDANSTVTSLAEYLGTSIADHVPKTPNRISEDMVRCMGAIYSKLAYPPLVIRGPESSSSSSFSSLSAISPQYVGDMWSPSSRNEPVLETRLINPFRIEGLNEFSGPYNDMVEVPSISRDSQRLMGVEDLLNTYNSLVHKLANVDVRKMKNDEKISFWINIHNALMMHAYLVHGVPNNSMKSNSLLIKATCIVGGQTVDANIIQGSFLGCRTHFSGQWLRAFLHPRIKLETKNERTMFYAIEKQEPLLHFALCSGSFSDPAVRIYMPKRVYQQLETAKEDYIRATVGIQREQKILLPKLIESYSKEISLGSQKVVDMIQCHLPEMMRIAVQRCQRGRSQKIIEWVPHNFCFRYILSREMTNPHTI